MAAVSALSYGWFVRSLGWYHDDWSHNFASYIGGGWLGAAAEHAKGGHLLRPPCLLWYPMFCYAFRLDPAVSQAFMLALEALKSILLFLLLERLLGQRGLALAATVIAQIYPARAVTHLWMNNSAQQLALALFFLAGLKHLDWFERGKAGALAAGQALYLVAVLAYESVAFLPLMLAAAASCKDWLDGRGPRAAAASALRMLAPFAPAMLLAFAWQWKLATLLFGIAPIKTAGFSAGHAAEVFAGAASSLTAKAAHLACRSLPIALKEFGAWRWLAWLASAAAIWLLLRGALAGAGAAGRRTLALCAAVAAAVFAAAYLPYSLSKTGYIPVVIGEMSRVNSAGVLAAGLLLAAGLARLRSRPGAGRAAAGAAAALLVAASLWSDWFTACQWARSYEVQKDILAKAAAKARGLPAGATVILTGAPVYMRGAILFEASWAFNGGLGFATGRRDLRGLVMSYRVRFEQDAVEERFEGVTIRYPYKDSYLYRYDLDRLDPLPGPPAGMRVRYGSR